MVENFQINSVRGRDMICLGDLERKDLIPFIGLCTHIKAGIEKFKKEIEKGMESITKEDKH
jgi:hypothetical protein